MIKDVCLYINAIAFTFEIQNKTRKPTITTSVQRCMFHNHKTRKKGQKMRKKKKQLFIYYDIVMYVEDPKIHKLLELMIKITSNLGCFRKTWSQHEAKTNP